jgi:hypothetical protein
MLDNMNLQDLFSSAFKSSEAVSTANQAVFTPEVLSELSTNGLAQYNRIEAAIQRLVVMMGSNDNAKDLATAVHLLRQTSLTYLPKV